MFVKKHRRSKAYFPEVRHFRSEVGTQLLQTLC